MTADFFFIGGAPKSGTTWLQKCLDLHPDIVCSGEGHLHEFIVKPLTEILSAYNRKLAVVGRVVYEGEPYYGQVTRREQIEIIRGVMSLLMSRRTKPGARLIGDKTPANAKVVEDLAVLFPTMKFVSMLRDPRDVAASRIGHARRAGFAAAEDPRSDGYRDVVKAAVADWRTTVERVHQFGKDRPQQVLVVKYEDLLDSTAEKLRGVFDFLGVETTADQLARIVDGASFEALSGGRPRGVERQDSFYRKGVKGDWRNLLSDEAVEIVTQECGDLLSLTGYAFADDRLAQDAAL